MTLPLPGRWLPSSRPQGILHQRVLDELRGPLERSFKGDSKYADPMAFASRLRMIFLPVHAASRALTTVMLIDGPRSSGSASMPGA